MAEHEVSNLGVEGSIPFTRSNKKAVQLKTGGLTESGNVSAWKAVAYLTVAGVRFSHPPPNKPPRKKGGFLRLDGLNVLLIFLY